MSILEIHRRALHNECEIARHVLHLATGIPVSDIPWTTPFIDNHLLIERATEIAACCERARARIAVQWDALDRQISVRDGLREWERTPDTLDSVDVAGILHRQATALATSAGRIQRDIGWVVRSLAPLTDDAQDGVSLVQA